MRSVPYALHRRDETGLGGLKPLVRRFVLAELCGFDLSSLHHETPCRPSESALIWLAAFVYNLPGLSEESCRLLLTSVKTAVVAHVDTSCRLPPGFQIALIDGRFAAWTGQQGILDLQEGEGFIPELRVPPAVTTSLHLDEFLRRRFSGVGRKIAELEEDTDAHHGGGEHSA